MQKTADLTGQRFGKLTVIERTDERQDRYLVWRCKCDCGEEIFVNTKRLTRGTISHCGCASTRITDLTSQRFGKLTVIERTDKQEDRYWVWRCRCDCGREILVNTKRLTRGTISHCGCDKKSKLSLGPVPEDLTGKRYGQLTVLRLDKQLENGKTSWFCQCDCGNQCIVSAHSLHYQKRKSCGCRHREAEETPQEDLTGRVFGRLTVVGPLDEKDGKDNAMWKCKCECGTEIAVSQSSLLQGYYKSCGCVRQERQETLHDTCTFVENTCVEVLEKRKSRSDNTSGFRGVSKGPGGKWLVTIGFQRKRYYLGLYSSFDYAVKARLHIEEALHDGFLDTYKRWQEQAQADPAWASSNPFYFNVEKSGSDFHIDSVFESSVISTI